MIYHFFTEIFVNICVYKKRKNHCGELQNIVGINVPQATISPRQDLIGPSPNHEQPVQFEEWLPRNESQAFFSRLCLSSNWGATSRRLEIFICVCLFVCLSYLSAASIGPSHLDFNYNSAIDIGRSNFYYRFGQGLLSPIGRVVY